MSLKICPNCAKEISVNASRCPYCSTALLDSAAISNSAPSASDPTVKINTTSDIPVAPHPSAPADLPIVTAAPLQPNIDVSSLPTNSRTHLPSFKETAERFNTLADQVQFYSIRALVVCGLLLLIIVIYMNRPVSPPRPLPAGVATLLSVDPPAPPVSQSSADTSTTSAPAVPTAESGIATYLTFLQKIDLQRIGLVSSFNQALSNASGSTSSAQENFSQPAQDLMGDYLAQKPPTECSDLSNTYFRMLQDQTGMIGRSSVLLQSNNLQGAVSIHDAAVPQLVADAQAADASMTDFCTTQHIDKPFTIQAEPGGSPSAASNTTATQTTPPNAAPQPPATSLPSH